MPGRSGTGSTDTRTRCPSPRLTGSVSRRTPFSEIAGALITLSPPPFILLRELPLQVLDRLDQGPVHERLLRLLRLVLPDHVPGPLVPQIFQPLLVLHDDLEPGRRLHPPGVRLLAV